MFEFGYGLSYSKSLYKFTHVSRKNLYLNHSSSLHTTRSWDSVGYKLVSELGTQVCDENKFKVGVGVKNDGKMSAKHPVLCLRGKERLEMVMDEGRHFLVVGDDNLPITIII